MANNSESYQSLRLRLKMRLEYYKSQVADLTLFEKLWLLAPIMIWFSYSPVISLGGDSTMNYELSLTLIYVAILGVVAIPTIIGGWRKLIKNKLAWLVTALVVWTGLTVLWSSNWVRGTLTFGIVGLLYLVFLATLIRREKVKWMLPYLVNILISSAVVACTLALAQMVAGTYIQSRTEIGLCAGCVAGQFGFVRPNLFAIEPQFFGSLLLAPTLIMLHRLMKNRRRWQDVVTFTLLLTTLGLTLSRGAIYAFVIAIVVMAITVKGRWLNKLASIDLMMVAVLLCLGIQGGLAAINPYINETFMGAVTKSVDHMTMGAFELSSDSNQGDNSSPIEQTSTTSPSNNGKDEPAYDGYVAESTDVRVNLTKTALAAWADSGTLRQSIGTGLGSAGKELAKQVGSSYEKEIVQNEYAEVLLERGAVGFLLLIAVIVAVFRKLRYFKWAWAIVVAYLIQYCFFSGLPNALHVFLVMIALCII